MATAAALSGPQSVVPTADGGFLIADTNNHRIRKVSAAGIITTGAGTKVGRGRVAVRDFRRKKTVTVRAGKRYLARARR